MKRILLTIQLVLLCAVAFSTPVSIETARTVATNFWETRTGNTNPVFQEVSNDLGLENMYVFITKDNDGFVIVSANDVAIPILGYSFYNGIRRDESIPLNMFKWLNHYSDEIKALAATNNTADTETAAKWNTLISNNPSTKNNGTKAVAPLITTMWNQTAPYNNKCPYDKDGSGHSIRAVTGCVATAMAQVMKFWEWPIKGTGSKTYTCYSLSPNATTRTISADFDTVYKWSIMPNGGMNGYNDIANSWTATQKNAVALLMFHCGVSVNMSYSYQSSGAIQSNVVTALKNYFYYSTSSYKSKSQYSDANWKTLIKNEIDAGRPTVYGGSAQDGTDGHSFVCDGYDDEDNFHFNWGWSGSGDGYYPLSSLNPGSGGVGSEGYNFTYHQDAVIGIIPGLQTNQSFNFNNTDNTVEMLSRLTGSCGFRNTSAKQFTGYLGVAAYNDSDELVTIIAKTGVVNVNANGTKTLNINYTASAPITAGQYTAKAVCSIDGTNWKPLVIGYNNCPTEVDFTVTGIAYTVTALPDDENMGTVSGGGQFLPSSTTTITATPNEGFTFGHWNDNNTEASREITVNSDTTFTAYFEVDPTYEFTINAVSNNETMGSVTGGGQYVYGSNVTITATPNQYYRFVRWNDNNTQATRTINVTGNASYTAYFEPDPQYIYTVTVVSADESMGTVSGGGEFFHGSAATISASANLGYRFAHWDDNNSDNPRSITVTETKTYTAYFENDPTQAIEDISTSNVSLFPNPTNGILYVNADALQKVEVIDAIGRIIISQSSNSVDMTNLNNGIYTVRITSNGNTFVKKVVKK